MSMFIVDADIDTEVSESEVRVYPVLYACMSCTILCYASYWTRKRKEKEKEKNQIFRVVSFHFMNDYLLCLV